MFKSTIATGLCFGLVLALGACSQQEEQIRIQSEPIFNKFGTVVGCSDGSTPSHDGDAISDGGVDQINPCILPAEVSEECTAGSYRPHPLSPCMEYDRDDSDTGGGVH